MEDPPVEDPLALPLGAPEDTPPSGSTTKTMTVVFSPAAQAAAAVPARRSPMIFFTLVRMLEREGQGPRIFTLAPLAVASAPVYPTSRDPA